MAGSFFAIVAGIVLKTPESGKVGFMYMLAGGADAGNTDSFASKPEPGNNWINSKKGIRAAYFLNAALAF